MASTLGRGTKRKLEFSPSAIDRLAAEAEDAALKKIKEEQEEALKSKLPDFWLPSLTPTYTSVGIPKDLKDIKVRTTCKGGRQAHELSFVFVLMSLIHHSSCLAYRLKSLTSLKFTFPKSNANDTDQDPMCPSCKKGFSNTIIMFCKSFSVALFSLV